MALNPNLQDDDDDDSEDVAVAKMGQAPTEDDDFEAPPAQAGAATPSGAPAPGSPSGTPSPMDIKSLLLSPQDLQQARQAEQKNALMGSVADNLSNRQSFGNFFLRQMNPHVNASAPFTAANQAIQQGIQDKGTILKQQMELPQLQTAMQAMDPASDYSKSKIAEAKATFGALAHAKVMDQDTADKLSSSLDNMNGYQVGNLMEGNPLLKTAVESMRNQAMLAAMSRRLDQGDTRNDIKKDAQAAGAAAALDNNSTMTQFTRQRSQIQKGLGLLQSNQPMTGQTASEEAANFASILSGARGAGLEQANKMEYNSAQGVYAKAMQWASGHPQDAMPPDLRQSMIESYQRLDGAIAQQQGALANRLKIGRNFQHNPAAQQAIDAKAQSYQPAPQPTGDGLPGVNPAAAQTGRTVSLPELSAYAQKHGMDVTAAAQFLKSKGYGVSLGN